MPTLMRAPLELPRNCPFFLWGEGPIARESQAILHALHRGGDFKGFITRAEEWFQAPRALILLTSPHWPRELEELRHQGVPEQVLVVWIHPFGNPHGYYELFREHTEELELVTLPDNGEEILLKEPNALLRRMGTTWVDEQGRLIRNAAAYYRHWGHEFAANPAAVERVDRGWSDTASRALFHGLMKWSPEEHLVYYSARSFMTVQYFDRQLPGPGAVILNLGVESGFELPYYLQLIGPEGRIHCVDPLGEAFLHPAVAETVGYFPESLVWHRVAAMDRDGQVELVVVDNGRQASLRSDGTSESRLFPCRTLEGIVEQAALTRLDLIKLDVEGAEALLLPGLVALARRFRPMLAVSVYHDSSHLVAIPLFLMQELEHYDFHLGHYSFMRYETVLYAIPRERKG